MLAKSARHQPALQKPHQSSARTLAGHFALGRRTLPLVARPSSHPRPIHRFLQRAPRLPLRFSEFLNFSIPRLVIPSAGRNLSYLSSLPTFNLPTFQRFFDPSPLPQIVVDAPVLTLYRVAPVQPIDRRTNFPASRRPLPNGPGTCNSEVSCAFDSSSFSRFSLSCSPSVPRPN